MGVLLRICLTWLRTVVAPTINHPNQPNQYHDHEVHEGDEDCEGDDGDEGDVGGEGNFTEKGTGGWLRKAWREGGTVTRP